MLGGRRYQVVGVARNTKIWSLTQASQPCLYLPLWQSEAGFAVMHVKSKFPLGAIHRMVERELERLDPSLPVASGRTLEQQLETALFPQRIALVMLGVFSISGIYLAAMGLFGVIAHAAQSRAKEIAIRMALGATAQDVCRLVAQQAAGLVGAGLCAGGVVGRGIEPAAGVGISRVQRTRPGKYDGDGGLDRFGGGACDLAAGVARDAGAARFRAAR